MLTHPSGLVVPPVRSLLAVPPDVDIDRERQRLRQELVRRIAEREMRRRIRRSPPR